MIKNNKGNKYNQLPNQTKFSNIQKNMQGIKMMKG